MSSSLRLVRMIQSARSHDVHERVHEGAVGVEDDDSIPLLGLGTTALGTLPAGRLGSADPMRLVRSAARSTRTAPAPARRLGATLSSTATTERNEAEAGFVPPVATAWPRGGATGRDPIRAARSEKRALWGVRSRDRTRPAGSSWRCSSSRSLWPSTHPLYIPRHANGRRPGRERQKYRFCRVAIRWNATKDALPRKEEAGRPARPPARDRCATRWARPRPWDGRDRPAPASPRHPENRCR